MIISKFEQPSRPCSQPLPFTTRPRRIFLSLSPLPSLPEMPPPHSYQHEVVRPLLVVAAEAEQRAVILRHEEFRRGLVFHRVCVVLLGEHDCVGRLETVLQRSANHEGEASEGRHGGEGSDKRGRCETWNE